MSAASALALVLLVGCGSGAVAWRGVGPGFAVLPNLRPAPTLSAAGAAVRIVDDAESCALLGFVSGTVARRGVRPAGADRAATLATLPRDAAIADARNLAAAAHANAIALDADELWETGRAVQLFVHGRALLCR